jgi:hypothetical protein
MGASTGAYGDYTLYETIDALEMKHRPAGKDIIRPA